MRLHSILRSLMLFSIIAIGMYYLYLLFLGYVDKYEGAQLSELNFERRILKARVLTAIYILPWMIAYYYRLLKKKN